YYVAVCLMLLFILESKCRAVWLAVLLAALLLYLLKKDLLPKVWQNLGLFDKVMMTGGLAALGLAGLAYNQKLNAMNLVGLDKCLETFFQIHSGSVYGRIKLWTNSLF